MKLTRLTQTLKRTTLRKGKYLADIEVLKYESLAYEETQYCNYAEYRYQKISEEVERRKIECGERSITLGKVSIEMDKAHEQRQEAAKNLAEWHDKVAAKRAETRSRV